MIMQKRAFTLLEIIVALSIMVIMSLLIVPTISKRVTTVAPELQFFNDLLNEHYEIAVKKGYPVFIRGVRGSSRFQKTDGTVVVVPGSFSVQSATVNNISSGLDFFITVYPDGYCDFFSLELSNKNKIYSDPILMIARRGL